MLRHPHTQLLTIAYTTRHDGCKNFRTAWNPLPRIRSTNKGF